MPRFKDDWVIDRVLFDYVSGGACACCGMTHLFLPNGTADLISGMTDLETDQQQAELQLLQHFPWPSELRDQIWMDRVKLRQYCKKDMKSYRQFQKEHGPAFASWLRDTQRLVQLQRWLQLPRSEIMETILNQKYNIHSAYAVVMCTVLEQIANFQLTQYPLDGKEESEIQFEQCLVYDKRCGFTIPLMTLDNDETDESKIDKAKQHNEQVINALCQRIATLGGPKLLERGPKTKKDNGSDSDDDNDANDQPDPTPSGPSFQSDRRILRLLIARYWADLLQSKFLKDTKAVPTETG